MSPPGTFIRLHHGTTLQRAESIVSNGPDVNFREPGQLVTRTEGFSTALPDGPHFGGSPEEYARRKAALFSDEGGPVILEMEVPAAIVAHASDTGDEIRFLPGWGLQELLQAWPALTKRIVPC